MCYRNLRQLIPFACFAVFAMVASAAEPEVTKVRLNGLDLAIDEVTGSLVNIAYPSAGVILEARPDTASLLDVAYPVESFPALRLASRFSKATVTRGANELMIVWDSLGPSRTTVALPSGQVKARVGIRAADDGRSVIMTCRIENQSGAPVPQILFPDLVGLKPFDGVEGTKLRLARGVVEPFQEPLRPSEEGFYYYFQLGWKRYPAGGYYSENALRWLDYGSLRNGLSIFQKKWETEDRPDILTERREADPMSLRLVWEHRPTIAPGHAWESGEFWFTPHRGGWAKGIEVYRDYVRQVSPPREMPRRVREGLGFETLWMIEESEPDPARAFFKYSDIPRVAQDALAHGINVLDLWEVSSFAPPLPIPLRPELGTAEEFFQAVSKAHGMGVDVVPHLTIQPVPNAYAARYAAKSYPSNDDWTFHSELIPRFRPGYTKTGLLSLVDSGNDVWQGDVLSSLKAWIDRGVVSFSWDTFPTESEAGKKPALVALIEKIRSLARAKDPESTFIVESTSVGSLEHDGVVADATWNSVGYVDAGPITSVLRAPRANCNVMDSPLVAKKAFADDMYLNVIPNKADQPGGSALISEKSALAAALKEVAALRRQFLPFFVEGTFVGDSVLAQPTPAFVRGYQWHDKLLVIALNDRPEPRYLTLQSELDLWFPWKGQYRVEYYNSIGKLVETNEGEASLWQGTTRLLQPGELALFVIHR
jgi:hypothetical protein